MKVGLKEENRYNMNMLVVNRRPYSRSTGARSTTLVPVLQKLVFERFLVCLLFTLIRLYVYVYVTMFINTLSM